MTTDEKYMKRAIELAWRGIGRNSPNPLVGCVIVKDNEIVGEGFHLYSEVDHAETVALKQAGDRARGSTIYISLEPCSHIGRTPPCVDAIIEAGVTRVVYGLKDPNPIVNGQGHEILAAAGIEVRGGILSEEIREQNKFFVSAHEKGRPYILLKWAMTADGKIATRTDESKWISNEDSRNVSHHFRNIYDAVLVGHSTVMIDNPSLTCRVDLEKKLPRDIFPVAPEDIRHPVKIVIDALGATCSDDIQVYKEQGKTLVAIAPESDWDDPRARDSIDSDAIELIECPLVTGHIDLKFLMNELRERGIHSVMVEGGGGVHAAFLEAGLADEVAIFVAPKIFGGDNCPTPVAGTGIESIGNAWQLNNIRHFSLNEDLLIMGKIEGREGVE